MFKPQEVRFLNNTLKPLNKPRLRNYDSLSNYVTKFFALVNKPRSYLFGFKMDGNFYTYKFQSNFDPDSVHYFEKYT